MRYGIVIATSLLLTACYSAVPTFYNGQYYVVGDKSCVRFRAASNANIVCLDKKGNETGYRRAMTEQEIYDYQRKMAQVGALNQSMQDLGNSANNWSNYYQHQAQSYTPPQVQPVQSNNSNGTTTYRKVGDDTIIGPDGKTWRRFGSTVVSSEGKMCQIVSQNIICN